MLHPAPTTPVAPSLARGVLDARLPETATQPERIVLSFHNLNYQVHLLPVSPLKAEIGKRAIGTIQAEAKRVDVCSSGGRFVEPVIGRPRKVQGSIVETDASANTITVDAGMPIVCRITDPRQRASGFEAGQFVTFDVLRGATFTPAS
ncbi:MAG: hypothetical protein AAF235_11425 [Planctomycetota bacterium]